MKKNNTTQKQLQPQQQQSLQKAEFGLDQNAAEQSLIYSRIALAERMHTKKGRLAKGDITELVGKLNTYFGFHETGPYVANIEDAFQMVYINQSQIANQQWSHAKVLRFDALELAGLRVKTWSSFVELAQQAKAAKNTKAILLIEQTTQVLGLLFTYQGVKYDPNTIKSLGLALPCESVDEEASGAAIIGAAAINVKHEDHFMGYIASYKSNQGCGRCILTLCRDSNKTRTNVKVAALRERHQHAWERITELELKNSELEKQNTDFLARIESIEEKLQHAWERIAELELKNSELEKQNLEFLMRIESIEEKLQHDDLLL